MLLHDQSCDTARAVLYEILENTLDLMEMKDPAVLCASTVGNVFNDQTKT